MGINAEKERPRNVAINFGNWEVLHSGNNGGVVIRNNTLEEGSIVQVDGHFVQQVGSPDWVVIDLQKKLPEIAQYLGKNGKKVQG